MQCSSHVGVSCCSSIGWVVEIVELCMFLLLMISFRFVESQFCVRSYYLLFHY